MLNPEMVLGWAPCELCRRIRPVCCSHANLDDGTYDEPICVDCCRPHLHPTQAGIGGYERADCDT